MSRASEYQVLKNDLTRAKRAMSGFVASLSMWGDGLGVPDDAEEDAREIMDRIDALRQKVYRSAPAPEQP